MEDKRTHGVLDRRSFLKRTGAAALGATLWSMAPFKPFSFEEALVEAAATGEKVVPTFCGMCGPAANCGIYAFTKNGKFTKVAGMKESPVNKGGLCPKAHAAQQWVYSPDRLMKPLKRVGAKGEGKFTPITYDEALNIIAGKLKEQKSKYGPETLGMLSPARRDYSEYMYRFLIAHGSPNYGHSGICVMQRIFTFSYTLGAMPVPDYKNADVILIWGKQPIYQGPAQDGPRDLLAAKKRGAKLIAIKPTVEPDVGLSDMWVPLRPGTDAAFGLGMLNVVVNENLIDQEFVDRWCHGYEQLKAHLQQYTPAWAEKISGVPAEQIKEVARLYAKTKKATIDLGNGVEHSPSCNDAIRCMAILVAITGHLDRPGGNLYGPPPNNMPRLKSVHLKERYTKEWVDKLVGPEFPRPFQPSVEGTASAYYRMFDSVLTQKPYPMRTIIAPGSQATVSTRGTKRIIEALEKLDFYVVADTHRTADMPWADVVIPLATPYEIDHPFQVRGNFIMARNKVIKPVNGGPSMQQFLADLAVKMGYGADYWNGSMTACQNYQLENFKMTIDELRAKPTGIVYEMGQRKFEKYEQFLNMKAPRIGGGPYLPQGKVAIYNTQFEEAGYTPMPVWREPAESPTGTPELLAKYPLFMSDYHTSVNYTAGWQRNLPYLREQVPEPTLHIHPDEAAKRGIKNGDWIIVESPHAWLRVKAELWPGTRPDTVMMLHGWWQGCKELGMKDYRLTDGGANSNVMYSTDPDKVFDPLVTAMSSQTLVQVRKA